VANTIFGAMRGLETFSQLVTYNVSFLFFFAISIAKNLPLFGLNFGQILGKIWPKTVPKFDINFGLDFGTDFPLFSLINSHESSGSYTVDYLPVMVKDAPRFEWR
jgi:hypothetical protein